MNHDRAIKMALAGAVLVAGALWLNPPAPLMHWLKPETSPKNADRIPAETANPGVVDKPGNVNPLSGLTADQLQATLDRPLFNPGRAGHPKVVEAQPAPEPVAETETPPAVETLNPADFSLLAVAGNEDALVAMVRWNKNNQVYRLRAGQYLSDIKLESVALSEAVLTRNDQSVTIALFTPKAPGGSGETAAPAEGDSGAQGENMGQPGQTSPGQSIQDTAQNPASGVQLQQTDGSDGSGQAAGDPRNTADDSGDDSAN